MVNGIENNKMILALLSLFNQSKFYAQLKLID